GNGVNGETHVHAALAQSIVKFADFVLRLGYRHAVSGNHDDPVRGRKDGRGFFRGRAANGSGFFSRSSRSLYLTKGPEQNVGEGTVHGPRHADGEDEARRSVERAGDDEQLAVEDEAHGRR